MYPALALRMQLRIGPQLVLASRLLRASSAEIEQTLLEELAENPALELARGLNVFQRTGGEQAAVDVSEVLERQPAPVTARSDLEAQIDFVADPPDREVLRSLIYLLDAHGYLREPDAALARQLGYPPQQVERARAALQKMEPPGTGARDLRECLLLQCNTLREEGLDCAVVVTILETAWEEFCEQRWSQVSRKTHLSPAQVAAAREFIARHLHPYPLHLSLEAVQAPDTLAAPDLVVCANPVGTTQKFRLVIPGEERLRLRLSRAFDLDPWAAQDVSAEERAWISAQCERARVFIASLEQRWVTLRRVGEYLLAFQEAYFERGPGCLRPVTRAEVAEQLGLHESTISRAVSDKVLQLPNRRLIPLSDLFDAALPLKEALRAILINAAGTLSDREIAERLRQAGHPVARRTIGKYREQLRIPNRYARQVG